MVSTVQVVLCKVNFRSGVDLIYVPSLNALEQMINNNNVFVLNLKILLTMSLIYLKKKTNQRNSLLCWTFLLCCSWICLLCWTCLQIKIEGRDEQSQSDKLYAKLSS